MSIQQLREQRAAKAQELQALVSKEDWNPETDQPIYDQGMAEIDDLDLQIKNIADLNARLAEQAATESMADAAARHGRDNGRPDMTVFAKWLKGGDKALTDADWASVRNTMSTTTGSEGGFTVDSETAQSVLNALKAYGGMRSVATVIQTTGVGQMNFPTSDGTSEEGEIVAENASATDEDVSFGTVAVNVFKYSSKVVAVPIELLQDSNVDIEAFVNARLVDRIGRITNRHFTVGTGVSQPRGVATAAAVGKKPANGTSQVTAVTYDSLVDLQHSVDPAYRNTGRCVFMMNDNTLRDLRKIKDDQKRPIFVPGYEEGNPGGAPDRILGAPIVVNQSMEDMAADTKSILYGDFSHYTIRDAMAYTLFRFTDSAYSKKGQVGFMAWARSGGNLVDVGGAVKALENASS